MSQCWRRVSFCKGSRKDDFCPLRELDVLAKQGRHQHSRHRPCAVTLCFDCYFGPISFYCIQQSESNQWTKASINCAHLSHKSGAINQTSFQRMGEWGESGCRDYCCEFTRSSLGCVSGFALRSTCWDLFQVEVEEAQTHFKIKDSVFGGTLSCVVVLDFSGVHIFVLFLFGQEERSRFYVYWLESIDFMHQNTLKYR